MVYAYLIPLSVLKVVLVLRKFNTPTAVLVKRYMALRVFDCTLDTLRRGCSGTHIVILLEFHLIVMVLRV